MARLRSPGGGDLWVDEDEIKAHVAAPKEPPAPDAGNQAAKAEAPPEDEAKSCEPKDNETSARLVEEECAALYQKLKQMRDAVEKIDLGVDLLGVDPGLATAATAATAAAAQRDGLSEVSDLAPDDWPHPAESPHQAGVGKRPALSVRLARESGLPEGAVVSVKVGDVRRQAPAAQLLRRPLRFPPPAGGAGDARAVGVTVLGMVASETVVLHPCRSHYAISLPGGQRRGGRPLPVELTVSGRPGAAPRGFGGLRSLGPHGEVGEYFESQRLLQYLPALLQAAIQERADDPYAFMRRQLAWLLRAGAPARLAPGERPPGEKAYNQGGMSLTFRVGEELPEGAVVSVRLGNERQQARAATLHSRSLHFPCGALAPLKIAVLVPEGSKKVALAPVNEHHCVWMAGKDGGSMALEFAVQQPSSIREPSLSCVDEEGDDVEDGQAYLDRHGLVTFARLLFKALAEERPENPYAFAMEYIARAAPGAAQAPPAR